MRYMPPDMASNFKAGQSSAPALTHSAKQWSAAAKQVRRFPPWQADKCFSGHIIIMLHHGSGLTERRCL